MQYDKQTPRREVTISEVVLKVISPFAEGQVLTAEQANVLNQTLAENLRNNFAPVVKAAKETAGGADKVDQADLQKQLNEYTKEYDFGARRTAGVAVNPVEKIAISLARDAVKKTLTKQGKNWKDFTAEQITELARGAVAKYPHFTASAQQMYDAKKASDATTLGEIAA